MSRTLFVSALVAPSSALAHVGTHHFDATGTLLHSVSYADHVLALLAALTLPVAAAVLIWNRRQ